MPRDFVKEMDRLFSQIIDDRAGYVLRDVAAEACKWCEENDPELLEGWLKIQAEDMMWAALHKRESATRNSATRVNRHAVFEEALRSAEPGGDRSGAKDFLSMLDARYACNKEQVRKKYGQMNKEEVLYVAGIYAKQEKRSGIRRMFHEMVASQLSEGQVVGDEFTPHRLMSIQLELGIND